MMVMSLADTSRPRRGGGGGEDGWKGEGVAGGRGGGGQGEVRVTLSSSQLIMSL